MKLSSLLAKRQALLEQAHLANLAFAYDRLSDFALRVERARLVGRVRLRQPDPKQHRFFATLAALDGSQSVIDEHFNEEDLMDFVDVIAFVTGIDDVDLTFHIEDIAARFAFPLRVQLARKGVSFSHKGPEATHQPPCVDPYESTRTDEDA